MIHMFLFVGAFDPDVVWDNMCHVKYILFFFKSINKKYTHTQ